MAAAATPERPSLAALAEQLHAEAALPSVSALTHLRDAAQAALRQGLDWPTGRSEGWRHSPLGALPTTPWRAPTPAPVDMTAIQALLASLPAASARLVFVDGVLRAHDAPAAQAGKNFHVGPLREAPATLLAHLGSLSPHGTDAFAALNTAQLSDGAAVAVAKAAVVPTPVQLVFVTTRAAAGKVLQPRVLVHVGRNAEISVEEVHLAPDGTGTGTAAKASWTNVVTELLVDEGARLDYAVRQHQSGVCYHIGTVGARLERDARLGLYTFDDGGKMARRAVHVQLLAPGAEAQLGHVALARAGQHQTTQATVQHVGAHTRSQQIYKAAVAGSGNAAFGGLVDIAPNAPQVAAEQLSRALLLTKGAQATLQPQLQILTDDVKCAHGATVGELDQDALFYLMSRGIAADEARKLLTFAFLGDALGAAPAALRPAFIQKAADWLGMAADVGQSPPQLQRGEA